MESEHPDPEQWWRHRRRLAYLSMALATFEGAILAILAWADPGSVEALATMVYCTYALWSVPIVGYYGNTAIDAWKGLRR